MLFIEILLIMTIFIAVLLFLSFQDLGTKAHAKHQMNGLDKNLTQEHIQRGQPDITAISISIFQGLAGHASSSFWWSGSLVDISLYP